MIGINTHKQLNQFRREGKPPKELVNYLICVMDEEESKQALTVILREMKALGFTQSEVVRCLDEDFGFELPTVNAN